MDAFWGPVVLYGAVSLVGIVIAAIGAAIDEYNNEGANIVLAFGGSVLLIGAGGAVVHLIGNLVEYLF